MDIIDGLILYLETRVQALDGLIAMSACSPGSYYLEERAICMGQLNGLRVIRAEMEKGGTKEQIRDEE